MDRPDQIGPDQSIQPTTKLDQDIQTRVDQNVQTKITTFKSISITIYCVSRAGEVR